MAYASWSVVFGEQPSAAKWNILGTNDAHFYGFLGDNEAWTAWSPTLSGRFDDADWTKTGAYIQIGHIVHFRLKLVATTAAPMGGGTSDARFALPVNAHAGYSGTEQTYGIGVGGFYDSGTAVYACEVLMLAGAVTTGLLRTYGASSALTSVSSTSPFTWTTNDEITFSGTYQAAA